MRDLRPMLAGFWVAHFDPIFVSKPPLPDPSPSSRPHFNDFRPTAAVAYLHLQEDGSLQVNVWRNDGWNKASHNTIPGTFTVGYEGLYNIATGEFVLEPAPDTKVHIFFVVRDQSELYFIHDRFESGDPAAVAPLTHGVFKRAQAFGVVIDPSPPERDPLPTG